MFFDNTKLAFSNYVSQLALLSHQQFNPEAYAQIERFSWSVDPTISQTLYEKASEDNEVLKFINFETVVQISGEKIGISSNGGIMGRTDEAAGSRNSTDPTNTENFEYKCERCEFDIKFMWTKLDNWAHKENFQTLLQSVVTKNYGQDLQKVGWNGTHSAKPTNKVQYPLLQDVKRGWLQAVREDRPSHVMNKIMELDSSGNPVVKATKVCYGDFANNKYKNLDALVTDAKNNLLPSYVSTAGLIVIAGANLLNSDEFKIVNDAAGKATEVLAGRALLMSKQLGGLPVYKVPYFPDNTIFITKWDNLSIYEQLASRRRTIRSNPDKFCEEDLQSANLDWVVEDFDYTALIENIVNDDQTKLDYKPA